MMMSLQNEALSFSEHHHVSKFLDAIQCEDQRRRNRGSLVPRPSYTAADGLHHRMHIRLGTRLERGGGGGGREGLCPPNLIGGGADVYFGPPNVIPLV